MEQFSLLRRKKLILKFTPLSVALEALAFAALIAGMLAVDRFYPALPETVPTAFAADGSALAWGVKETTLLHAILSLFVYIILTALNFIVRQSCPPDRPLPVLRIVLDAVAAAKTLFLAHQAMLTWCALRLQPAPRWPLYALIAAEAAVCAVTALLIRKTVSEA